MAMADVEQINAKQIIERILQTLQENIQQEIADSSQERRASRSYRALPKHLLPRYLDKKL